MHDQFLTYSNLLVYLGFNIAAFAFISQYLSFPKDLLAELSRVKRDKSIHEFPYEASKVTNNIKNKVASDKMKAFFLEADTVIFATLIYLLFSILFILFIIMIKLFTVDFLIKSFIVFCALIYMGIIVFSMSFEFIKNNRKWPKKNQRAKKWYMIILIVLAIKLGLGTIVFCWNNLELLFILLIFGLLIHFFLNILTIWIRMPVTQLVALWENLLETEQDQNTEE